MYTPRIKSSNRLAAPGREVEACRACYVDGVMFGEAVTWAEDEVDSFELI
jgi:hypothetical protein